MAYFDPKTKIFHGREIPQIYHPEASLGQVLLFNFFKNPNKVIQVCDEDGIELTCSQIADMMKNIAKNLFYLGARPGEVAGLFASNSTYVGPAIFGCYLYGLALSPIDKSFDISQIVEIYKETKPKLIFCDHEVTEKLIRALVILESDARIVTLTDKINGFLHISDLISASEAPVQSSMNLGNSSDVCAAILCTSGSSGSPKLARVSHAHMLQMFSLNQFYEESFTLNFSSTYWLTGFSNITFQALNLHKRLVTSKSFSTEISFDLIEKYKLKHVFLLPPHVSLFVESPRFKSADLSSIQMFTSGGLFLSEQLRKTLQSRLPNGKVCVGYGMTEVGGIVTETDPNDTISSSVGRPTVNTRIKILIDDGTIGGVHEIGEVLVQKPMKFMGYVGSHHASIEDHEGWVHTGDMGYIDEKFELIIVGQRTFVIKNFYNEIFPNEIEQILRRIQGVESVCVVGTPDEEETEVPAAIIVRKPNSKVTEQEVIEATNHLPPFKRIRDVFFVEDLPLSSSGKFQRRLITQIAEELKILALSQRTDKIHF